MHVLGGIRTNIPAIKRFQIHAVDHTATGIGELLFGSGEGDNNTLFRQNFEFS
jgi:hypothetical protein